jgi:hypothetical protein
VEVNQRALIDKILARYASANAVYRELLQNSNDASATRAEIYFDVTLSNNHTNTTTNNHTNINNGSNHNTVTQVLYLEQWYALPTAGLDSIAKNCRGKSRSSQSGGLWGWRLQYVFNL